MGFVCGLNHGKMGWVIHVGLVMKMQRQMGAKRMVLCMEKRLCNVNGIQHWRNSSTREAEQSVFFVKKEKQYDEMNCSDLIRSTLVGESFPTPEVALLMQR